MKNKKVKVKKTMRLNKREKEFLMRHRIIKDTLKDEKKEVKDEANEITNKNIASFDSEDIYFESALLDLENAEKLIEETIEDISHENDDKKNDDNNDDLIISDVKKIKEELEHVEKELKTAIPKEKQKKKILKITAIVLCGCIFVIGIGVYKYNDIKDNAIELEKQKAVNVAANAKEVNISDSLREYTVSKVKKEEKLKSYSLSDIYNMDVSKPSGVTAKELSYITKQNLVGLEEAFVKAEEDYGVNCLFLVAIASMESANGTICFKPNNMFGYGSSGYSSKAECIDDVANGLANNYLKKGASLYNGKTISDVNKRYASSSTWDDKVARNMYNYYSIISEKRNSALKKL